MSTSAVREGVRCRPIPFTSPLVRAIVEGRKTETRRIIKPQPSEDYGTVEVGRFHLTTYDRHGEMHPGDETFGAFTQDGEWAVRCPYGEPGDRLWVREAWAIENAGARVPTSAEAWPDGLPVHRLRYPATDPAPRVEEDGTPYWWNARGPRFMPRWASRLTLEIVGVGVERLQEITEDDARAEGMAASESVEMRDGSPCYTLPFRAVWTSLYGEHNPKSWDANPWVWVIRFKPLHPEQQQVGPSDALCGESK